MTVEPVAHERAHRGGDLEVELPIVGRVEVLERHVEALALERTTARRRGTRRPARRRASPTSRRAADRGASCAAGARRSASATSPWRWRSWNSSSSTAETPRRSGSASSRRVSTPSVTKRTRVRALDDVFEANRVADGLADALTELFRDAPSGEACREPTWLEHDDLAGREPGIGSSARDARRLAGARRRLEHERRRLAERGDDLREDRIDREVHPAAVLPGRGAAGDPRLAGPQGCAVPGERAPRRRARPRAGI